LGGHGVAVGPVGVEVGGVVVGVELVDVGVEVGVFVGVEPEDVGVGVGLLLPPQELPLTAKFVGTGLLVVQVPLNPGLGFTAVPVGTLLL
jgi:hypothetical protein